jgi:HlyD family secretion protein
VALEQAKQDEVVGIQEAEADLASARRDLQTLQDGATDAEIAGARATVASAQASLASLRQGATAEERAIAQASVDQARIALEQLTTPGSAASIASAEASVAQAEVALAQAQQDLAAATLAAPIAGVVAEVLVSAGDSAGASTTITVLDPSKLYVELSLSESDVAGVEVGQAVALSFDALPDAAITGTVTSVAPVATVTSNVATYPVRVSFDPGELPIKVGMTASGTIVIEERAGVLIVPSRAVTALGDASVVRVQQGEGQPAVPVRVETGLSSDGQVEILGCVDTGDMCLQEGDTLVVTAATSSAASSTTQGPGGLGGLMGGPPPAMGR